MATATTTPCEAFCDRVVRCDLAPASDCLQQCRDSQLEQQQNGPAVLAELAQASCERLAEMSKQPAQAAQQPAPPAQPVAKPTDKPPAKRTQWMCNATGWWQKCETTGYPCYGQTTMMLGFGSTEAVARVAAETECNTAMLRLMGVNFTYHTSVTQRCRAISCSPPNAK